MFEGRFSLFVGRGGFFGVGRGTGFLRGGVGGGEVSESSKTIRGVNIRRMEVSISIVVIVVVVVDEGMKEGEIENEDVKYWNEEEKKSLHRGMFDPVTVH